MKKLWAGITAAVIVGSAGVVSANADPTEPVDTPASESVQRFVVTRSDDADTVLTAKQTQQAADRVDREVAETMTSGDDDVIRLDAPLNTSQAADFMADLAAQPGIELVEPVGVITPSYTPNDPDLPNQWYVTEATTGTRVSSVWDYTRGAGVTVAVLDSGKLPHSDLDWVGGYDFLSDSQSAADGDGIDPDPTDAGWATAPPNDCALWHGTMVGGVIGAQHNAQGLAGLAPEAKLVPVRVLGTCGGDTYDLTRAIRWASGLPVPGIPNNPDPARVINLSLGGVVRNAAGQPYCPTYLQNAINDAVANNAVVVAAAGNSGRTRLIESPAICSGVIAVTATDRRGDVAGWADRGSRVNIAAPGDGIYTTGNQGTSRPGAQSYAWANGTSFSTPVVSAAIALMLAANPKLDTARIHAMLGTGARPVTGCGDSCGAGLLDISTAVGALDDPIVSLWRQLGAEHSVLGIPRDATFDIAGGRGQRYAGGGYIYQSPAGVHPVVGGINAAYQQLSGPAGRLGFPASAERAIPGGYQQSFQSGHIYWTAEHNAQPVVGGILDAYLAMNGAAGRLGFPASAERAIPGGYIQSFQNGAVFWTPDAGAQPVIGAIGQRYLALGGSASALGFPASAEQALPDGGYTQRFQHGTIYWSPQTGAQPVVNAINATYQANGAQTGKLGYPTSGEQALPDGGYTQRFQHGTIYWSPQTGAQPVVNAINATYQANGAQTGKLGYPTSGEQAEAGGSWIQRFQHGYIRWSPTGSQVHIN